MDQWIPAKDFIAADVVRWTEGVFDRRRKGKKAMRIGERLMIGEVLDRSDDGWVRLLILGSTITKDEIYGKAIPPMKPGVQLRRGVSTLSRGKPERLKWSDESARDAVLGKFQGSQFVRRDIEP
ncbi:MULTISPECIES: hypothetical protein [unclassified Sphingomonas]|uniref:hypothetical protein n=1 Tax=unclassified Sphingomonas TaxID=196159 RepID=UPI000AFD6140|nr:MULTISPECIES: hypothetical protein [unclassified Sphingomonas]